MACRRPSTPGEMAGVPPLRRLRSTPTTSGWGGAGPSAPTGTTGSKPSGNSRPRLERPGGTSLRPPGEPPSEALAGERGGFVGSRLELHDGDEPNGPLRVEHRVEAFQHVEDLGEVAFDVRSRGVGLDDQTGFLKQFVAR